MSINRYKHTLNQPLDVTDLVVRRILTATGTITAADFNSTSDIKFKTNIKPIISPLSKLLQLNGVTFNWKEDNKQSVGVIAQEVEKVFPELVEECDDHKVVKYNGLIGVLIESVKEVLQKVENLEEKINIIEKKLSN